VIWIFRDTVYGTHLYTLRLVIVTYTFGALVHVNFVDFFTRRNRLIRAFRFTYIAVDAIVGDN